MKLAAIDIGSNSIKLIVVEAKSSTDFHTLAREKVAVRLGSETLRTRHLSPESIARAAETIKRFNLIANVLRVEQVISIATAAVREADNADEFVREIGKRTGVHTEVLSGAEEARLIGLAAAYGCGQHSKSGLGVHLNIDIGGGSTEFSAMLKGEPLHLQSTRIGAVGLTEKFATSNSLTTDDVQSLREEIDATFQNPARELHATLRGYHIAHVTGTSGTIIAIGNTLAALNSADANVVKARKVAAKSTKTVAAKKSLQALEPTAAATQIFQSREIILKQLDAFNERIAGMTLEERLKLPGISPQRAEILVAGSHILAGAMHGLKLERLTTCDWALREGVIVDRLREIEAERKPPVPDKSDPRLRGVHLIGTQFRYDEKHARHVAKLAERLFDDLHKLHRFGRSERTLLAAAALLHDIGYAIAHEPHHKHSHYIIKHCELTNFTERERHLIALIARYHRRALPKERHADYAALDLSEQKLVWCLASILRLAEALDRSHDARVKTLKARLAKNQIIKIELSADRQLKAEVRAALANREMFEQAFGHKLNIADKNHRLDK